MLDRFGPEARGVVSFAEEEAQRLGHAHVGTEHILVGLLGTGGATADVLRAAGATLDGCRSKVGELVGRRSRSRDDGPRVLTERAHRVLTRADRLSLRRRAAHVEPDHILVSLLDVEGTAGQVLRGVGVDVADLRSAVSGRLDQTDQPVAAPAPPATDRHAPGPRCGSCGAQVDDGVPCRVVHGEDEQGGRRPIVVVYCPSCGSVLGAAPA